MITEEKKACFVDEWIEIDPTYLRKTVKQYYRNLGYKGEKFIIRPWHLTKGSDKKVRVKCPICDEVREVRFNNFYRAKSTGVCNNCKGEAIKKDLTGQRFGKLIAIKDIGQKIVSGGKYRNWLCKCDCGNTCEIVSTNLLKGHTKSCGCLVKETSQKLGKARKKDLIGLKFNRLTVIEETEKRCGNNIIWKCKCDCGNITEVAGGELTSGKTKSCGCLAHEIWIDKHRKQGHFVKEDHTQEEIDEHLKNIKSRSKDFKWKELSKQIRKTNNKCCICGSKEKLAVHHINGYWEFPEQRYDENNLVVMCQKCHQKYHANASKITIENFNEWRSSL